MNAHFSAAALVFLCFMSKIGVRRCWGWFGSQAGSSTSAVIPNHQRSATKVFLQMGASGALFIGALIGIVWRVTNGG
jgi:hypothetical protein